MWWKKLLFTGLYTGYFPIAPGTAGTILAFLIYVLVNQIFGEISWIYQLCFILIIIYPSIKICDEGVLYFNRDDPSQVVIDEIYGYWVSVLFYPFNWKIAIIAFFLFRLFDIIKPYPVNKFDNMKGGFGIMMDDIMAGIYSNLFILCLLVLDNYFEIFALAP